MKQSLRRRLLVTIIAAIAPVVALLAIVLFQTVRTSVWSGFDADLSDLADAMTELLEYDDDGYEFELGEAPDPLTRRAGQVTYLELRDPQGSILSRTPGLGDALDGVDLDATARDDAGAGLQTLERPEGQQLRLAVVRFVPETEQDARPGTPAPGTVTLVLARETQATRSMLMRIGYWFAALGFVTLGAASFAAWWAVRQGLIPVRRVATQLAGIDGRDFSTRIDAGAVPEELEPIVSHTNALLDRLEASFDRERRFTSNVAHELRTPLSVLRTSLELALRRPQPPEHALQALREDLEVVEKLSVMVDNLLTLARLDGPGVEPQRQEVSLGSLVSELWSMYADEAANRGLEFRSTLDPEFTIETDRELVGIVVSNLLANAVAYTEAGGWIEVSAAPPDGIVIAVADSGPPIPAAQHEQLFERTWRADEARSNAGVHCGIGLALVRCVAGHLGYRVELHDHPSGGPSFEVLRGTGSVNS